MTSVLATTLAEDLTTETSTFPSSNPNKDVMETTMDVSTVEDFEKPVKDIPVDKSPARSEAEGTLF